MRKALFRILPAVFLALAVIAYARDYSAWRWVVPWEPTWPNAYSNDGKSLTQNNGAHCVAMHEYDNGKHRLLATATLTDQTSNRIKVYEYLDIWDAQGQEVLTHNDDNNPGTRDACIDAGPNFKHVAAQQSIKCWDASQALTDRSSGWPNFHYLTDDGKYTSRPYVAVAGQVSGSNDWLYVAHRDDDGSDGIYCSRSSNGGEDWYSNNTIEGDREPIQPSLGVSGTGTVYCAYQRDLDPDPPDPQDYDVYFRSSTDNGANWSTNVTDLTPNWDEPENLPCLAASGSMVFVCWEDHDGNIVYRWSSNGGSTWNPQTNSNPAMAWEKSPFLPDQVNAVLIPGGTWGSMPYWHIMLVAKCIVVNHQGEVVGTFPALKRGVLTTTGVKTWYPIVGMSHWSVVGDFAGYCPSICGESDTYDTLVACAWADPGHNVNIVKGRLDHWSDIVPDPGQATGVGRRLAQVPDATMHYVAGRHPYIITGPVLNNQIVPLYADCGFNPALAVDGDTADWLAYTRNDTVWCVAGKNGYKAVFAGSSSAVPGQPSIVCYPNQANGVYVGNVVFPVYDTAGGASKIMFARVDTSAVVLDTIESVANLKDSLPSVSVFRTDSILVTWQHGTDSVLSALLPDYGPGTAGRPGAWSSPNLVTASGHHPMSVMDGNGTVLNCDWTNHSGSNYSILRATNDLSGGMFGGWVAQTSPSTASAVEKANSVYAGVGVSVWQQKVSGKWVIKGFVRGAETTLVANDTDAYNPSAVAESSAISPSISQIRCHLLYTAGVTFDVDSGVTDTGDVRYMCDSFNVSHAGSNATAQNNGSKLIRQGDSLFSVYGDLDGSIVYAWSASGDSWQRSIMTTSRDNPAIGEDSTGKRWVIVHKAPVGMFNGEQQAYYRNGSSWTGPQTLYSAGVPTSIGPASVAGASSTTSSIAYAAFKGHQRNEQVGGRRQVQRHLGVNLHGGDRFKPG